MLNDLQIMLFINNVKEAIGNGQDWEIKMAMQTYDQYTINIGKIRCVPDVDGRYNKCYLTLTFDYWATHSFEIGMNMSSGTVDKDGSFNLELNTPTVDDIKDEIVTQINKIFNPD